MRPPKHSSQPETAHLFQPLLVDILGPAHELVILAGKIDWEWLDGQLSEFYSTTGRAGIPTRLMAGLHLLKHSACTFPSHPGITLTHFPGVFFDAFFTHCHGLRHGVLIYEATGPLRTQSTSGFGVRFNEATRELAKAPFFVAESNLGEKVTLRS